MDSRKDLGPEAAGRSASGDVASLLAGISGNRTSTWTLLAELTARPSQAFVARLAGGGLLDEIGRSVRWLDESWRPSGLLVLGVLGRRALRRGVPAMLDTMVDTWVAATPRVIDLHVACERIAGLCAEELAAWQRADDVGAKALRVRQMAEVAPQSPVRVAARELADRRAPVYGNVADLILAYLRLETGR